MKLLKKILPLILISLFTWISGLGFAQISPGDLCEYHAHLEGMSNCTNCHILGEKVSNDKCLDCHKEVKSRIAAQKGYHASSEVKGKSCSMCHNDHHGRAFKIIRFDPEKFNHNLAGYKLEGAHAKKTCKDCHKPANIKQADIKKKKYTYQGLDTKCASCHEDYHQNTLSQDCQKCHNNTAFKPASLFKHSDAKFQLNGKHAQVECQKCHKMEQRAGKKFQVFGGLKFDNCVRCHEDVHKNKFGQDCKKCHSETSFLTIKSTGGFDHNNTDFKLLGKHEAVKCNLCHKNKVTDPVPHKYCYDCHKDFHEKQFVKDGVNRNCAACHTNDDFVGSTFSFEQHNQLEFKLQGGHLATPCFSCHKKTEKWRFREIGKDCIDCHDNIHEPGIEKSKLHNGKCVDCHTSAKWSDVNYNHSLTKFALTGIHAKQSCRKCHFKAGTDGTEVKVFTGLSVSCSKCHKEVHNRQFEKGGETDCASCHSNEKWKIDNFNHDKTAFKLDGQHKNVACVRCHSQVKVGSESYVLYKTNKVKCENCH